MAKFQSPLLGYNNNVRHKGRLFHIQTEDSGVNHPHVITHLFMDGGRILKSQKRSYAEHVGSDGMSETVKQLMKEQHKGMLIALRDGQFDALVENAMGPAKPAPAVVPDTKSEPAIPTPPPTEPDLEEPAPATINEGARASVAHQPEPEPKTDEVATIQDDESSDGAPDKTPKTTRDDERKKPSVQELTLDFDALERDTTTGIHPILERNDLPPPPKHLLTPTQHSSTGRYREVDQPRQDATRPAARSPATPSAGRSAFGRPGVARERNGGAPAKSPSTEGRYAPTRPAAIFGASQKPVAPSPSFGDDPFRDKSLDEVILSYLAEDLDPPRNK
jgi:hypothetical protein